MTQARQRRVALVRVYDSSEGGEGARVLVDGLWPRGIGRDDLLLHSWERAVAPSTELRRWFDHEPTRFPAFRERYLEELEDRERDAALRRLAALADDPGLVIVTATAALEISHAEVLRERLALPVGGEGASTER